MLNINEKTIKLVNESEEELKDIYNNFDNNEFINSQKVLNAFHEYNISESDLNGSTGYGYNDIGRDKIEKVFARVLGAEDALVRSQFVSGTHAISTALFALLRPFDKLLIISSNVYDTLHDVIGIKKNNSSLKSFNIDYEIIDLIEDDFDYDKIKNSLDNVKVVHIQRSRGYSLRKSLTIEKIEKVIKFIKNINKDIIVFVDNCYCEFVETKTPIEVGADLMAGSLIKNLGGGIAKNGGYITGNAPLIDLCAQRLNPAGTSKEVGPSINANREILQGLYFAPSVVCSALKTATLTAKVIEKIGFESSPKYNEKRADIVQLLYLKNKENLINYTTAIQASGAIDSYASPQEENLPGYDDKIIMASASFVQGSSIEISADAPLKSPYVLYQQGALTYNYGKLAVMNAISKLYE